MVALSTGRAKNGNDTPQTPGTDVTADGVIMTSHYDFWYDRRDQFSRGYKLIKKEIERLEKECQRKGRKCIVDSMQIQRFISLLNDAGVSPLVIEDVINFAIESNTFNREKRRYSDIDVTQTQDQNHDIENQIEKWASQDLMLVMVMLKVI